ncbi:MAG: isoaspartyl peptidase/L-asparaginase [Brevundimonas sp.]|nr:isoaspartyl peptidase/L-asparaginase [Brevundimonas sp.]
MKPISLSMAATALALAIFAAPAAAQEAPRWSFAIHGGAGVIERASLTPEQDAAYRAALHRALEAGSAVLANGGSSLDAVQAAIELMEDDPLFNAGRGAVFTAAGRNELDAAVMNGSDLTAGAVAGLTTTRHPIAAARAVMERSPHVMLIGEGADTFAASVGLEQVDPAFFLPALPSHLPPVCVPSPPHIQTPEEFWNATVLFRVTTQPFSHIAVGTLPGRSSKYIFVPALHCGSSSFGLH